MTDQAPKPKAKKQTGRVRLLVLEVEGSAEICREAMRTAMEALSAAIRDETNANEDSANR